MQKIIREFVQKHRLFAQTVGMLFGAAVTCAAQSIGAADNSGPALVLKWIAQIILACFFWGSVIGLIWKCIQSMMDRSHLAEIVPWALFSGLGFAAYFIVSQMRTLAVASF